ncbi:uncharacterized protein LOC133327579 [Musca vetustissima]|uniref:uncharacterized protein LOC133327579 n=1 Tax=Musca vetustissima TaxID=27455 RepID=UPI002AB709F9|nr:uncharacterized protein LOC133327579 [Musca vetustissima]
MFSFFTKKAQNPDSPVIIQGPSSTNDSQNSGADDFIFVEKKGDTRPEQPTPPQHQMYPQIPPGAGAYGSPYPTYPYGPPPPPPRVGNESNSIAQNQNHPVPYVHDIPFVLAPQLCTKSTFDDTQTQVDGILAFLTRQMSVTEQDEYNFSLERSIQNECY